MLKSKISDFSARKDYVDTTDVKDRNVYGSVVAGEWTTTMALLC